MKNNCNTYELEKEFEERLVKLENDVNFYKQKLIIAESEKISFQNELKAKEEIQIKTFELKNSLEQSNLDLKKSYDNLKTNFEECKYSLIINKLLNR